MNKTQVSTDLALKGGVNDKKWTPASGSASLDVNVVRNQTHTTTNIKADNATLNVAGNTNLNGSSIEANKLNGSINGNLNAKDVSDKVNETKVSLAANADAKIEVDATRKEAPKTSGLVSQHSNVAVGHTTHVLASEAHDYHVGVNIHPTTHIKKMFIK